MGMLTELSAKMDNLTQKERRNPLEAAEKASEGASRLCQRGPPLRLPPAPARGVPGIAGHFP